MTSNRPAPDAEKILYRFWHLQRAAGSLRPHLKPQRRQDKTDWTASPIVAVCRHDQSHVPPHPECTCGIYAIGLADMHLVVEGHKHARGLLEEAKRGLIEGQRLGGAFEGVSPINWAGIDAELAGRAVRRGRVCADSPQGQLAGQVAALWRVYHGHSIVAGRVRLRGAVPYSDNEDRGPGMFDHAKVWRGSSAILEELYVEEDAAAGDQEVLRARLSQKYGVPVSVGLPDYTLADWEARTPNMSPDAPTWDDLGLYAPGAAPPPARFFTTTLPGESAPAAGSARRPSSWTQEALERQRRAHRDAMKRPKFSTQGRRTT